MRLVSRRRRREVADTLRSLLPLIPAPWSVDVFVRRVADLRNRPIRLVDQPLPGDITGLWIPTNQVDYVVVEEVNFVYIKHTAIGSSEDAGLKVALAALNGLFDIQRAYHAIFGRADREVHERGGQCAGRQGTLAFEALTALVAK